MQGWMCLVRQCGNIYANVLIKTVKLIIIIFAGWYWCILEYIVAQKDMGKVWQNSLNDVDKWKKNWQRWKSEEETCNLKELRNMKRTEMKENTKNKRKIKNQNKRNAIIRKGKEIFYVDWWWLHVEEVRGNSMGLIRK